MAATITLLKSFVDGEGVGADNFLTYAQNHDSNYAALETVVNQLVAEVSALQGPGALIAPTLVGINDAARSGQLGPNPAGQLLSGVLGAHSYVVTIGTPTSTLDVSIGQAVVGTAAGTAMVQQTAAAVLNGAVLGGSPVTPAYVNIDTNGVPGLSASADAEALDIASVDWNGSAFTGAVTREAAVFLDGDAWEQMQDRFEVGDGTTPTFPEQKFELTANRLLEIEQLLAGLKTPTEGSTALGVICVGGSAAAPGLALSDGATYDLATGVYRVLADVLGIAVEGTGAIQWREQNGGGGAVGQTLAMYDGTVENPVYSRSTDPDTGARFPGANRYALVTAGVDRLECDAVGNVDLPTNARVKGNRSAAQTITDATPTNVAFTAADTYEVPGSDAWHDHTAGATGDEEFTCPTDCDGGYHLIAEIEWEAPANAHRLLVEITVNNTTVAQQQLTTDDQWDAAVATVHELVATDVVRVRVTTTDLTATASLDVERAELSITKVW